MMSSNVNRTLKVRVYQMFNILLDNDYIILNIESNRSKESRNATRRSYPVEVN